MASITIPWNDGPGNIVLTYAKGEGNQLVTVTSDSWWATEPSAKWCRPPAVIISARQTAILSRLSAAAEARTRW